MDQLEDPDRCSRLSMEQFHRLLLRAGWEKRAAQKAANERGWERLSAGVIL